MKTKIFLCIVLFLNLFSSNIYANDNNKIVNEINNVKLDDKNKIITIEGWGFISDAQHFLNSSTHRYTLNLKSKSHSFDVSGSIRAMSHTETMFFAGSRYCEINEYNKDSTICNHRYENIGFKFEIPLSKFKMNQDYVATLKIDALNARVNKSSYVYYPNQNTITLKEKHNHYIMDSKLHDMSVKVLYDYVLVRNTPGKGNNLIKVNNSCANDKTVYYKANTTFNKVYEKHFTNNTTYYNLSGKLNGCINNKGAITQGNDLHPIWIASNFIEHLGQPLTIKTREVNNPPTITINNHPSINVGDNIDFFAGVSAYDIEDGDLTSKLKIVSNNYQDAVGLYTIKFSVTDSFGATTTANKYVNVTKANYPPTIIANDIEVEQFSNFDPYLHASAYDQDNNDISNKLNALNIIDTSILKQQDLCYEVFDKYNLKASKCIKVNIIKGNRNYRFISKDKTFYKERAPKIWEDKLNRLIIEINNQIAYDTKQLSK